MTRLGSAVLLAVVATVAAGCGDSKPPAVPTDPDSVRKLEELQKKGAGGEKR